MKKLEDLDVIIIEDNSALTVKGGCEGKETRYWSTIPGWMFSPREYGDWTDDGCCE